jgi:hypothetical protein
MKKNILLFFVSLISVSLFAQKGFHVGVSGAFTGNFIYTQNNYGTLSPFKEQYVRVSEMDYRFTYGGNGGFAVGYNFTKRWGLQAEVRYATAGQKYEDNFIGPATLPEGTFGSSYERVNVKREIKLAYVQIPIMAKYISKFGKKAKLFVCLGPQFGFRTAASEQVKIANITYLPDSITFTSSQKFKTFDMGLALQIGAEVYATDYLFFDIGLSGYAGILDLNGNVLKTLGWFSANDVNYQQSRNANVGVMVGIHYLFIKRNTEGF